MGLGLGLWLQLCLAACRSACLLACLPVYLLAQVLGLCHKMGDRRMHESMMNIGAFGSLAMRKKQDLLYVWFCWCLLHVTFSCFYCEIASKCKDSKKNEFSQIQKTWVLNKRKLITKTYRRGARGAQGRARKNGRTSDFPRTGTEK